MSSKISTIAETIGMNEMKIISGKQDQNEDSEIVTRDDAGVTLDIKGHQTPPNQVMANDILNDILETAMDIAIGNESDAKNVIDHQTRPENAELQNIIEGLTMVTIDKASNENAYPLHEEMKMLLNEIMTSPPRSPKNKHLGLGDSSPMDKYEEQPPVMVKPSKTVEKKSRITDLVMNSKKALNNLLNEEQRKKQDEWEENNEHIIQVIELDQAQHVKVALPPESYPLPIDDEDDLLLVSQPNEDTLDTIELSNEAAASIAAPKCGEGDEKELVLKGDNDVGGQVRKRSSLCSSVKRKKWNFSFKFFSFCRNRNIGKKEEVETEQPNSNESE